MFVLEALPEVISAHVLITILVGTLFGIITGAIPGFTVTMGVVLAFPFTFGMDEVQGIALIISVLVGGYSGGVFASVLLGIPGTASSIATTLDGYPMAKQGAAGKAIGLAILSCFFGNILGLAVLVIAAPVLAELSLLFGPWEISLLILAALTLVGSLTGGQLVLGCISAGLGLLVATVGLSPDGALRFTFDITDLANGFDILPVLVGAFAFSQLLSRAEESRQSSGQDEARMSGRISIPYRAVIRDAVTQKLNFIRSSAIGAGIGALPAIGATTSTFVAYDSAKRTASDKANFGKGDSRGLVSAETANNATLGGVLIPTLTLGIPGDITMAIIFGVLLMYGIQPGPGLFTEQPILMGSIYITLFIAGIVVVIAMLILARYMVNIMRVPTSLIVPIVLVLSSVGMFALNNRVFDITAMLIFGVLGYWMSRIGIPLTPLVLAVILGNELELNIVRAVQLDPSLTSFVTRPISASILGIILIVIITIAVRRAVRSRRDVMFGQKNNSG